MEGRGGVKPFPTPEQQRAMPLTDLANALGEIVGAPEKPIKRLQPIEPRCVALNPALWPPCEVCRQPVGACECEENKSC